MKNIHFVGRSRSRSPRALPCAGQIRVPHSGVQCITGGEDIDLPQVIPHHFLNTKATHPAEEKASISKVLYPRNRAKLPPVDNPNPNPNSTRNKRNNAKKRK